MAQQGPTRRQALYFPSEMLGELQAQCMRQDRSLSWIIQQAWKISRTELQRMPGTSEFLPEDGGPPRDA